MKSQFHRINSWKVKRPCSRQYKIALYLAITMVTDVIYYSVCVCVVHVCVCVCSCVCVCVCV